MPSRSSRGPEFLLLPVLVALGAGCSDDAPTVEPPTTTTTDPASEPRVVVAAGPHQFHVEPHASGHVYAYVGATVLEPASATVAIDVPVEGGTRTLTMRWDERERRYEGRATGVTILPGVLTVHLTIGGIVFVGTNLIVVVLPAVVVVHDDHGRHRHKHKHRGRH